MLGWRKRRRAPDAERGAERGRRLESALREQQGREERARARREIQRKWMPYPDR